MKFKVGDKVRLLSDGLYHNKIFSIGEIHVVKRIQNVDNGGVFLTSDRHTNVTEELYFFPTEVERVDFNPALPQVEPTGPGLASRANSGKIRPTLFPVVVYKEVLKVFKGGSEKYGDYNWTKGFKYMDCADSLERHWLDWKMGVDTDPESGLSNLAHIIANAAFLLYYHLTGRYKHLDDRLEHELSTKGDTK